ncbi:MAG: MFS transporter, partial [Chloroflexota bacterium]
GCVSGMAFPLLIPAMTGSPASAGFAGLPRGLPYLILSLPAGALIDRWDRLRRRCLSLVRSITPCSSATV